MTGNHLEEIKERLRRLMAVAREGSNATEAEVEAAITFATRLMAKHHLNPEDINKEQDLREKYEAAACALKGRFFATVGGKLYQWESNLGVFVAEFVGVGIYHDRTKRTARMPNGMVRVDLDGKTYEGSSLVFYGVAEDAAFATMLFYELWRTTYLAGMMKFGKAYTGDGGMYCQGFVAGIREANRKERLAERKELLPNSKGLMIVEERDKLIEFKKELAERYILEEYGIRLRKGTQRGGADGSLDAYWEGKKDGSRQTVEYNRQSKIN